MLAYPHKRVDTYALPHKHTSPSLTKQVNVDLLETVDATELVQLMVDLVVDESAVVLGRVVLHYVVH